jgi:hypothetical protein
MIRLHRYSLECHARCTEQVVEHNILTDMALETNDVGAINFGNGGDSGFPGFPGRGFSRFSWDQNNTIRYNNISRVRV